MRSQRELVITIGGMVGLYLFLSSVSHGLRISLFNIFLISGLVTLSLYVIYTVVRTR